MPLPQGLPLTAMKRKIAITTDSAADISKPLAKEYDLHILPMNILIAGSQFKDRIDVTPGRMLEKYESFVLIVMQPAVIPVV